jgi:hypothetical protein
LGSLKTNTKTVDNMMQVKPTNNSTWANIGISNLKTYNATLSGKKLLAKISKERAKANYFLSILERLVRLCFWDNKANTSFAPLSPNLLALLI